MTSMRSGLRPHLGCSTVQGTTRRGARRNAGSRAGRSVKLEREAKPTEEEQRNKHSGSKRASLRLQQGARGKIKEILHAFGLWSPERGRCAAASPV